MRAAERSRQNNVAIDRIKAAGRQPARLEKALLNAVPSCQRRAEVLKIFRSELARFETLILGQTVVQAFPITLAGP